MKVLSAISTAIFTALVYAASGFEDYNYDKVLELSLLFYEAQRSGYLPPDNRIPWRQNSALNDSTPTGDDLTGGYYDGRYFKEVLNVFKSKCCYLWLLRYFLFLFSGGLCQIWIYDGKYDYPPCLGASFLQRRLRSLR